MSPADGPLEGGWDDSEEVPAPDPVVVRKVGGPRKITPDLWDRLCAYVRDGSFKHVAAQAVGLSPAMLFRHLADPRYEADRIELERSEAIARACAESRVHKEKPTFWLSRGPGRDRGEVDRPGWTLSPKEINVTGKHVHAIIAPDLSRLSVDELRALENVTAKLLPAALDVPTEPDGDSKA